MFPVRASYGSMFVTLPTVKWPRMTLAIVVYLASLMASAVNVTNQVSASGTTAYIINGANNPTLTLTRGVTYVFVLTGLDRKSTRLNSSHRT